MVAQARADLAEQAVADLVAEGVVDLLEVVQVEQEQRGGGPLGQCLLDLLVQHQAVGEIGQAIVQRLVLERLLAFPLPPSQLRLLEGVLHGGSESPHPVLEDIVNDPEADGGDREVLADRTRDDDERDLQAGLLHQLQGPQRIEVGLMVVGDDQVELGVEIGLEARLVVDPPPAGIEAGATELVQGQVGVLRPILQDQQAYWASAHGLNPVQRGNRQ